MRYQSKAIVSLNNYKFNIENIQKFVGSSCKLMLIVKANAYGHGAVEMSRFANTLNIDYFGVANLDEAIELRINGVSGNILVLGHVDSVHIDTLLKYDLSITIRDYEGFLEFKNSTVKVHIKIDTGMSRSGFYLHKEENIKPLLETIKKIKHESSIIIEGIFTHFSSSESNKDFTLQQLYLFNKLISTLIKEDINFGLVHAANSVATIKYPQSHLDMVRIGLLSYGINTANNHIIDVKPVMQLKSYIIQLKNLEQGDFLGYGNTFQVDRPMKIAIVNLGYADGLFRSLSNIGTVLVKGTKVPIIGRISMDVFTIDVTGLEVSLYDEVTIFGNSGKLYQSISELADKINTIEYELFCAIGRRVKRVYK